MYRGRSFLDHGVALVGSSDRPVADGSPLRAIQFMVERASVSGRLVGPDEAVTVDEALRAYTVMRRPRLPLGGVGGRPLAGHARRPGGAGRRPAPRGPLADRGHRDRRDLRGRPGRPRREVTPRSTPCVRRRRRAGRSPSGWPSCRTRTCRAVRGPRRPSAPDCGTAASTGCPSPGISSASISSAAPTDGHWRGRYVVRVHADALRVVGLHPDQPSAVVTGPSPPGWWHAAAERNAGRGLGG